MKKILLVFLIIAFSVSCSSSQNDEKKDETFNSMFINVSMDKDIMFWEPVEKAVNRESVTLDLENISTYHIRFEQEKDIYILTFNGEDWVTLNNETVYLPSGRLLSPKGQDLPGVTSVSMVPYYSEMGSGPIEIRVVLVATLYENDVSTNQKTGAFVDMMLYP